MKTKEEILDEFDKLFAIHKGRKWILTEEEAKEVKDFISKIIDEILENKEINKIMLKDAIRLVIGGWLFDGGDFEEIPNLHIQYLKE